MKYLSKLVLLAMAVVLIGRAAEADAQSKPLCTEDTKCEAPYDLDSVPDDQGNCFKQDNIEFLQVCRWEGGTEGAEDEASGEDEEDEAADELESSETEQELLAVKEELVELQARYHDLDARMLDQIHESIEEAKVEWELEAQDQIDAARVEWGRHRQEEVKCLASGLNYENHCVRVMDQRINCLFESVAYCVDPREEPGWRTERRLWFDDEDLSAKYRAPGCVGEDCYPQ